MGAPMPETGTPGALGLVRLVTHDLVTRPQGFTTHLYTADQPKGVSLDTGALGALRRRTERVFGIIPPVLVAPEQSGLAKRLDHDLPLFGHHVVVDGKLGPSDLRFIDRMAPPNGNTPEAAALVAEIVRTGQLVRGDTTANLKIGARIADVLEHLDRQTTARIVHAAGDRRTADMIQRGLGLGTKRLQKINAQEAVFQAVAVMKPDKRMELFKELATMDPISRDRRGITAGRSFLDGFTPWIRQTGHVQRVLKACTPEADAEAAYATLTGELGRLAEVVRVSS